MEGRDIGTNIFPETDHKFYLDANLEERSKRGSRRHRRRSGQARSARRSAGHRPLMVPLGATIVNTSGLSPEESSQQIIDGILEKDPNVETMISH